MDRKPLARLDARDPGRDPIQESREPHSIRFSPSEWESICRGARRAHASASCAPSDHPTTWHRAGAARATAAIMPSNVYGTHPGVAPYPGKSGICS